MPTEYLDSLDHEERVLTVFRSLIRLYISSQSRARTERKWSLQQLAIEFEIEQASRLAPAPHTVSSLAQALGLSIKVVSKTTVALVEAGVIVKRQSSDDKRVFYLVPSPDYYANGGDGILKGISNVLSEAFGDSWRKLQLEEGLNWFPDPDLYSDATPEIEEFRRHYGVEFHERSSSSD